ncbi:MAG: RagB/SusD family nutrient uptake outer membrane protein [Prevotella sp.]|jgi:hypothetical protein|nr:RagB/SusD family nutrient uptake outer membrane protein [Prevotella sp.]
MKTNLLAIKPVLILLLAGAFTACSLEEELYDTSTISDITTAEDLNALIEGCYSEFDAPNGFKSHGYYMLTVTADDVTTDDDLAAPYGLKTYTGANTDTFWGVLYRTVRHTNTAIAEAKKLDIPAETLAPLVGEAYFLRAFSYYYLVRLYGGVPLRLDQVTANSNFYLPRASVEEVYAQIFADLDSANVHCPVTAVKSGRATKGAAQAIMASAKLTFASWLNNNDKTYTAPDGIQFSAADVFRQSIDWCDSVIVSNQYALFDDYGFLWNIANESQVGQEVIFALQFVVDKYATLGPSKGSEFAYRYMPNNYVGGAVAGSTGSDQFQVTPAFFNEYYTDRAYIHQGATRTVYDTLDYRIETSFMTYWTNTNNGRYIFACPFACIDPVGTLGTPKSAPPLKKYMDPNGTDIRNQGCDLNIIRYSEIFLLKAEALNELDRLGEAIDALNVVRRRASRAGTTTDWFRVVPEPLTSAVATDKGTMRSLILKERGLELIGEGTRWFDLVRMKSPDGTETMFDYRYRMFSDESKYPRTEPSTSDNLTWSNVNFVYWPRFQRVCEYRPKPNRYRLFPIPTGEFENNKSITENNPGW